MLSECPQPQALSLRDFVRETWHLVEPATPLIDSYCLGAMCEFLQAWCDRTYQHGLICVPPGMSKSLLSDVFAPAWMWAQYPDHRWLSASYDIRLTRRDANRTRAIVESADYQAAYPETRLLRGGKAQERLWTTQQGLRFSTSVAGAGIGWHFHSVVIDDPYKPQDLLGRVEPLQIERVLEWHDRVLPTRRAEGYPHGTMLIMQRLLEHDLAGTLLHRDGYEALILPMRFVPSAYWCRTPATERHEWRTTEGELLCEERFDAVEVAQLETRLGADAEAQLQQNPIPRTGGLLSEPDLRWCWGGEVPRRAQLLQVWDFAAKGTEASHSACCGQLWASVELELVWELTGSIDERERGTPPTYARRPVPLQTYYLLIDEVHGRWSVPESERQFELAQTRSVAIEVHRRTQPLWSLASQRVIEAKAAGIGVIQRYERAYAGVVAFHEVSDEAAQLAREDKLTRFRSVLPEFAGARVLLPQTVGADAVRKELLAFPRGAHDDRVDCASMALCLLTATSARYWAAVAAVASQRR